jgi:protein TonB
MTPNTDTGIAPGGAIGRVLANAGLSRYALASLGAFLVNLVLFGLLQSLVTPGKIGSIDRSVRPVFELLRLRRDETTEIKTRRLPERKRTKPAVGGAPLAIAKSAALGTQPIAVNPGDFQAGFSLTGQPFLGVPGGQAGGVGTPDASGAGSDTDAIPLVRVNPLYPARAQARGIQGWVLVEFTVTAKGTTKDIVVVDADPKGHFEQAATSAVKKYRYKPRVEDGVAVDRPGVQLVISFAIEE